MLTNSDIDAFQRASKEYGGGGRVALGLLDSVCEQAREANLLYTKLALMHGVSDKIMEQLVDVEILRHALNEALNALDAVWDGEGRCSMERERIAELRKEFGL